MPSPIDDASLRALLPGDRVGTVRHIERIVGGMSGASVHAVTTDRGEFILRQQHAPLHDTSFVEQLVVLRRAAQAGVAPPIVHVDEASRAVVSTRIPGGPLAVALADPVQRGPAWASLVERLRALHALDPSGVTTRHPLAYTRSLWRAVETRASFPRWARSAIPPRLDAIDIALASDRRQVVSHNDLNPTNVLWDGERTWFVDWEVAGLNHPHYDLATLALFLRLPDETACDLVGCHDGTPPNASTRSVFSALRDLAGVVCGLIFFSMTDEQSANALPSRADASTLVDCYAALRAGQLDLQSAVGKTTFSLALLREVLPDENA